MRMERDTSESLSDGELETFGLVAVLDALRVVGVERDGVAEPEHAERGEPLHGHAGRIADLIKRELVIDGRDAVAADVGRLSVENVLPTSKNRLKRALLRHLSGIGSSSSVWLTTRRLPPYGLPKESFGPSRLSWKPRTLSGPPAKKRRYGGIDVVSPMSRP